ncbi:hypothetical protein TanjilG_14037 [Lupinus angustifolius]|uniref:Uncharacterized protein n=1 Tax=Lupinus angustifolius TaxID=3871 RepID=A0A1J7FPF4_LUPAN|nr:hypothetical protein TanjilG_14037 [Lupinus angustifolius]
MGFTSKVGNSNCDYSFKVLLVGDSGVGKSSLLFSFISEAVPDSLSPTIGVDFKVKLYTIGGKGVKLTIWDTEPVYFVSSSLPFLSSKAFESEFSYANSQCEHIFKFELKAIAVLLGPEKGARYFRSADAKGILDDVYDVSRRETFTNVADLWVKEVERYSTNHDCIKILVGNKVDKESRRAVTKEEGMAFAQKHRCLFIECSAKTRENVQQCFSDLTLKILDVPSLREKGSVEMKRRKQKRIYDTHRGGRRGCCG